ncbi:hypothetical protein BJX64DRAFT_268453 [Aspergillus heterothallicus]
MIFSKLALPATFALVASALPQGTQSSTSTSSASPSSTSGASSSGGGVTITNNLNSTVYLWSTSSSSSSGSGGQSLSSGGSYTESWQKTSDGGVSIKMSTTEGDESSVLQFEYTNDGDTLYWDLSSINLDADSAFVTAGFSATPDGGGSGSSCEALTCSAGDSDCTASYQNPDDEDTHSCDSSVQMALTLG